MFLRMIGGGLVAASVLLCGFPAAAQERKPPSGRVIGELHARQNTPDGKNAFFEVLAPGEDKPRRYHVLYDPQTKGPIDSVLAAVRAAAIGDRVELDWEQTGHGPAAK